VERFEHYDGPKPGAANLVASGLLFRLLSNTVLKSEYLAQGSNSPYGDPGFKASLAILF
jgi:hypothetical protein